MKLIYFYLLFIKHLSITKYIQFPVIFMIFNVYRSPEASHGAGQGYKPATVSVTGCVFDPHSRKWNIWNFHLHGEREERKCLNGNKKCILFRRLQGAPVVLGIINLEAEEQFVDLSSMKLLPASLKVIVAGINCLITKGYVLFLYLKVIKNISEVFYFLILFF